MISVGNIAWSSIRECLFMHAFESVVLQEMDKEDPASMWAHDPSTCMMQFPND